LLFQGSEVARRHAYVGFDNGFDERVFRQVFVVLSYDCFLRPFGSDVQLFQSFGSGNQLFQAFGSGNQLFQPFGSGNQLFQPFGSAISFSSLFQAIEKDWIDRKAPYRS
jgi:hypothetical protein